MHLRGRETKRSRLADDTHRLDVEGDIARHSAVGFSPAQQSTYRLQPAIDGSRLEPALRHHVLPPSDQVMLGQPGEFRRRVVQAGVPSDEVQQIVAIAAAGCRRQVVGRQAIKEGL